MGHIKNILNVLARFGRHTCGLPSPEEEKVLSWLQHNPYTPLTDLDPYDGCDKLVSGMFDYDRIVSTSEDARTALHECRKKFQQNAHILNGSDKARLIKRYNSLKKSMSSMGKCGITESKAHKFMGDVERFSYHIDTLIYIATHPPAPPTFGRKPREDGQSATTLSPEEIQVKLDTEAVDAKIENIFDDPQSAWAQYEMLRATLGRFEDARAKQILDCADQMVTQAKQVYRERAHTLNLAQKVCVFGWYQSLGETASGMIKSDFPISQKQARKYHRAVEEILIQVGASYKDSCRGRAMNTQR